MTPQINREKRTKKKKQIEALGSFGATAQGLFRHAWTLFMSEDDTRRAESETLALKLLQQAQLGDLHKAGCHVILAHGTDNYVWHGEQALDIYTHLYDVRSGSSVADHNFKPSPAAIASQDILIKLATRVLKKAKEDKAAIEANYQQQLKAFQKYHNRDPTDDKLISADMAKLPDSFHTHMEDLAEAMDVLENGLAPAQSVSDDESSDEEIKLPPARGLQHLF